jgi:hypothetical protein
MIIDLKYSRIFEDHMKIAKERLIEKIGQEPTLEECLNEYINLMEYFYD